MDIRTKIIVKNIIKAPFVLMLRVPYTMLMVPLRVLTRFLTQIGQVLPKLEPVPPTPAQIEARRLAMIQRRHEARQRLVAQYTSKEIK
jgi:hypothetical protein